MPIRETFKTFCVLYTRIQKRLILCEILALLLILHCYSCQIRNQRCQKPKELLNSYNSRWQAAETLFASTLHRCHDRKKKLFLICKSLNFMQEIVYFEFLNTKNFELRNEITCGKVCLAHMNTRVRSSTTKTAVYRRNS